MPCARGSLDKIALALSFLLVVSEHSRVLEFEVINRRKVLAVGAASLLISICDAFAQTTAKRLVLIHGRGQEGLEPTNLQSDWLKTLRLGAQAAGRSFPDEIEVVFPYYGDTLEKFTRSYDIPLT